MTYLFTRFPSGDPVLLKVVKTTSGAIQSWSSWSLAGARVNLDTAEKWRALAVMAGRRSA